MIETPALPKATSQLMPLVVKFRPLYAMTPDEFYEFCILNPELNVELTAEGEVLFMPPVGGRSSNRNGFVTMALTGWALSDQTGVAFDSSGGFILPNGAVRSPDGSWVKRRRLVGLTSEQEQRFLPLCPDFVIELASPSDRQSDLQAKMEEYIANGARLGWLILPEARTIYVYQPDQDAQLLSDADAITGDPVLPGFTLDLRPIWEPGL